MLDGMHTIWLQRHQPAQAKADSFYLRPVLDVELTALTLCSLTLMAQFFRKLT